MASCACADVSNFSHGGVKMLLLYLWPECHNLVEKLRATLKI